MRYFDSNLNEGSLSQLIPNCTNPETLSLAELTAAGILTLPDRATAAKGKRWDPVAPTLRRGVLTGGWVLVDLPIPDPVADWQGWQIAQLQDPTWVAYCQTIPIALTTALTTLVSQVATQPDTVTSISAIWAGIAAAVPPDPVAQAAWVARAESFNLPPAFVSAFAA